MTAGSPGRALAIFHSADPLYGAWEAHPINAEFRYHAAPFSSGRCAGPFIRDAAGALLRPVHASRRFYGENVRLMRIVTLTPEAFHEEPVAETHPLEELLGRHTPHHFAIQAGLVALDVRDRIGYGQHLPLLGRMFSPATGRRNGAARPSFPAARNPRRG